MSGLGRGGAREIFAKKNRPPPMVETPVPMRVLPQEADRSRWQEMPRSTNIEDRRQRGIKEQPQMEKGDYSMMEYGAQGAGHQWSAEEQYMYQHHAQNLKKGGVKNPDGSTSTYRAIGVEQDGKYYMIPTIWNGKKVSDDEAMKNVDKVGWDKFPSYANQSEAEARYKVLHDVMEQDIPQ